MEEKILQEASQNQHTEEGRIIKKQILTKREARDKLRNLQEGIGAQIQSNEIQRVQVKDISAHK